MDKNTLTREKIHSQEIKGHNLKKTNHLQLLPATLYRDTVVISNSPILTATYPPLTRKSISLDNEFPIVNISLEEIASPERRNQIAEKLSDFVNTNPASSTAIGLLPSSNGTTTLLVASRENAIKGSRLEGVYGVIGRLANSPALKAIAKQSNESYSIKPFNNNGKVMELTLPGKITDYTLQQILSEGSQPNQMSLVEELIGNIPKGQRAVLLIGGPSGSGKSSIIKELKEYAKDRQIVPFAGDMYFLDADDTNLPKTSLGRTHWNNPGAMHFDEMSNDIVKLIKEGNVELPVYNFNDPKPGGWRTPVETTGYRENRKTPVQLGSDDILVLDSIHAMNPKLVETLQKNGVSFVSIYLDSSCAEERLVRRLVRDFHERSRETDQTIKDWDQTTFPGEVEFIRPTILQINPKRDLFLTRKFPTDLRISREELNSKIKLFAKYGIEPSYEALAAPNDLMMVFAQKEVNRFEKIINTPASTPEEKKKASAGLDRLRKAPDSVIVDKPV